MISSCQHTEDFNTELSGKKEMASRVCPCESTYVTLTRPHTALLFATVRGGLAERGAYTIALADKLASSKRRKDIYDIHRRAVKELRKNHGIEQTPEFRSTLEKEFVLPGISHVVCYITVLSKRFISYLLIACGTQPQHS